MIHRVLEFLVRVKDDLKKVDTVEASPKVRTVDEDDGALLSWAEQKGIRRELRRFLTWHALRMKVPKGWESPE